MPIRNSLRSTSHLGWFHTLEHWSEEEKIFIRAYVLISSVRLSCGERPPSNTVCFYVKREWVCEIGEDSEMKSQQLLSVSRAWLLPFQLPVAHAWRKNYSPMKCKYTFHNYCWFKAEHSIHLYCLQQRMRASRSATPELLWWGPNSIHPCCIRCCSAIFQGRSNGLKRSFNFSRKVTENMAVVDRYPCSNDTVMA